MASVSPAVSVDSVDRNMLVTALGSFPHTGKEPRAPALPEQPPQISAEARLRSAIAELGDAAFQLTRPEVWQATVATSSDDTAVQAISSSDTPIGRYEVEVGAIATPQTVASASFSSLSTVIGLGTLNIELGSWNASQSTFATNPNWPKASLTMGPRDNSLERVRDKINAAGIGVVAMVVSDATGSRLVLRSSSTGSAHGFKVSATPSDDPQLEQAEDAQSTEAEALSYDPRVMSADTGMALLESAQNARLTINNRRIESVSNTILDETNGMILTLKGAGRTSVQIDVQRDPGVAHQAVIDFAQAYNNLRTQVNRESDQTELPEVSQATSLLNTMETAFTSSHASAMRLTDAGIQLTQDGLLNIDEAKLQEALDQNPQGVRALFVSNQPDWSAQLSSQLPLFEASLSAETAGYQYTAPPPLDAGMSSAGMQFRQRLLDQYRYAQPLDDASSMDEASWSDRSQQ